MTLYNASLRQSSLCSSLSSCSLYVVRIGLHVVNCKQDCGSHLMTLNQMSNVCLAMADTCLAFALNIQRIQVLISDWTFFNITILSFYDSFVLFCYQKWIWNFEMSISVFAGMLNILKLSKACQSQHKLFFLYFKSFVY